MYWPLEMQWIVIEPPTNKNTGCYTLKVSVFLKIIIITMACSVIKSNHHIVFKHGILPGQDSPLFLPFGVQIKPLVCLQNITARCHCMGITTRKQQKTEIHQSLCPE